MKKLVVILKKGLKRYQRKASMRIFMFHPRQLTSGRVGDAVCMNLHSYYLRIKVQLNIEV